MSPYIYLGAVYKSIMLNKKYKCPVCLSESINVKQWFQCNAKNYIECNNCNSKLTHTKKSRIESNIPLMLFWLPSVFLETKTWQLSFIILGGISSGLYLVFLGELEHYIHEEPAFNLNKFLDNLKNSNSEK